MERAVAAALTAAALLWLLVIVLAPFALGHSPRLWAVLAYEAAGLICHQRPERSFHLAGVQMPVCARCFALYASGAVGALAACVPSRGIAHDVNRVRAALACAALPTALTVAIEWVGAASLSNTERAIAALPLGSVAAWLFIRALRSESPAAAVAEQMRYHA